MTKPPAYHIPQPCSKPWAQMTPQGDGRHCQTCDKVVIDFTRMAGGQAQQMLAEAVRSGREVCGHCRIDERGHLLFPPAQPRSQQPWRRHVLTNGLALLFAVGGTGCSIVGEMEPTTLGTPMPVPSEPQADGQNKAQAQLQVKPLQIKMIEVQSLVDIIDPTESEPVLLIGEIEAVDQPHPIAKGEIALRPLSHSVVPGRIHVVASPPPEPQGPSADG